MLLFNNKTPKKINFNGKHVAKVIFNNVVVWLEKVLTTLTGYPITLTNSTGDNLVDYKIYGNSIQSNLPEEYQQVKYIESTGTQIIDTGIKANLETKIIFDYQFYQFSNTVGSGRLFGCRTGENSSAFICSASNGLAQESVNLFVQFDNVSPTTIMKPLIDTNRHVIELSKNGAYYDGELWRTIENATEFTTRENLLLFALWNTNDTTRPSVGGIYRLYSCKLYESDMLVRDFIPCYRKSDNVIGMYDLVNDVFYTNAGTGTFTKGDNVTPTPDTPVGIQSAGDKTENLFDKKYNVGYTGVYPNISTNINGLSTEWYEISDIGTSFTLAINPKKAVTSIVLGYVYSNDKEILLGRTAFFNASTLTTGVDNFMNRSLINASSEAKYVKFYITNASEVNDIRVYKGYNNNLTVPYGYKIPIKLTNESGESETTNIYLDEPLRKIGNYADYIEFVNKKVVRNVKVLDNTGTLPIEKSYQGLATPTEKAIELPTISTNKGTNIIEVDTNIKPSKMEVQYYAKEV